MAYRLAEMSGTLDVDDILRRPAKWFRGWQVYFSLDPDPELRADYRAASIAAMIANVHRGEKQKPYTLDDVRIKFDDKVEQKKEQTPEQQFQILKLWAVAMSQAAAVDKE